MLNILIVDDSLLMRKKLKTNLVELGHKIIGEAVNGKEAIEKYNELHPDIVTMDVTMPIMDGLTALKEIKSIDCNANIIMITSHGHEQTVLDALNSGAKGYILKPVTYKNLAQSIGDIFPKYANNTTLQ